MTCHSHKIEPIFPLCHRTVSVEFYRVMILGFCHTVYDFLNGLETHSIPVPLSLYILWKTEKKNKNSRYYENIYWKRGMWPVFGAFLLHMKDFQNKITHDLILTCSGMHQIVNEAIWFLLIEHAMNMTWPFSLVRNLIIF